MSRNENYGDYPTIKEILLLLGVGAALGTAIFLPGMGYVAKFLFEENRKQSWDKSQKEWKKFNKYLLKRNLQRLYAQKIIEIVQTEHGEVIKLTQRGRTKFLKLKAAKIAQDAKHWDHIWRLILYDISTLKKNQQEQFHKMLVQMNFLRFQKSVYLFPYPCQDSIEYLRSFFGLNEQVTVLEVTKLENEAIYKSYFGL